MKPIEPGFASSDMSPALRVVVVSYHLVLLRSASMESVTEIRRRPSEREREGQGEEERVRETLVIRCGHDTVFRQRTH